MGLDLLHLVCDRYLPLQAARRIVLAQEVQPLGPFMALAVNVPGEVPGGLGLAAVIHPQMAAAGLVLRMVVKVGLGHQAAGQLVTPGLVALD